MSSSISEPATSIDKSSSNHFLAEEIFVFKSDNEAVDLILDGCQDTFSVIFKIQLNIDTKSFFEIYLLSCIIMNFTLFLKNRFIFCINHMFIFLTVPLSLREFELFEGQERILFFTIVSVSGDAHVPNEEVNVTA
jgi:hypothetical protein